MEEEDYTTQQQADADSEGQAMEEKQMDEGQEDFGSPEAEAQVVSSFEGEVKKYSEIKKKIELENNKFNGMVSEINKEISNLTEKKAEIYKQNFKGYLDKLQDEEGLLKENLLISFPKDTKSVKFDFGMIGCRDIKGIAVTDPKKLLAVLVEKKMLDKAVKTFDTAFLKKGFELGLFDNSGVNATSKRSLVFTPNKEA